MNVGSVALKPRRKNSEISAETCQKILDAAEHVFCAKGVSNSTMEDIALHANMTRGAVYWHYRDKNDLLTALLASVRFPIEDVTPGKDFAESSAYIKNAFLAMVNSTHLLRLAKIMLHAADLSVLQSPVRQRLGSIRRYLKDYFEQVLRLAVRDGELPPEFDENEIPALAITFRAVLTGLLFELMLEQDEAALQVKIDLCLSSFFNQMQPLFSARYK